MRLLLIREFDNSTDTIGKLYFKDYKNIIRYVYTIEDSYNDIKIPGNTRISAGQYEITLRKEGGVFERYCRHKDIWIAENTKRYGLVWIRNVPNYEYILIHIGNTSKDSEGCILVGDQVNNTSYAAGFITDSTVAYKRLMNEIYPAFNRSEKLSITIIDHDKDIKRMFV